VVGATGATGRHLVAQLLARGAAVKAVVRDPSRLGDSQGHPRLTVLEGAVADVDAAHFDAWLADCDAAASCLGHNLSFRGLLGPPYRLVANATARIRDAFRRRDSGPPARFVLMNTAGIRNRNLDEPIGVGQQVVLGLLRALLPPHADNEAALENLRGHVPPDDPCLEWVSVRPDNLIDADAVSPYTLHPSPTRSAIFDPGKTSRINVAHFMAELLTDDAAWSRWKGQMPVIYNQTDPV